MKAQIYYNDTLKKDYSGEGPYVLVIKIDGEELVIDIHGCSNRNFANHDLTGFHSDFQETIDRYNITEIESNGLTVWRRKSNDELDQKRKKEFANANYAYESKYCSGFSEASFVKD